MLYALYEPTPPVAKLNRTGSAARVRVCDGKGRDEAGAGVAAAPAHGAVRDVCAVRHQIDQGAVDGHAGTDSLCLWFCMLQGTLAPCVIVCYRKHGFFIFWH